MNPSYPYNTTASGVTYTFSGAAIPNVKGARVVGLINKAGYGDSAYLRVREVQIFN